MCFSGILQAELGSGYAPRPVMTIHGTADPVLPYDASVINVFSPVPLHGPPSMGSTPVYSTPNPGAKENLAAWGGFNGCPGAATTETALGSYTLHELDCNGVVSKLVELPGVGHYPFKALYNVTIDDTFYIGASFDPACLGLFTGGVHRGAHRLPG